MRWTIATFLSAGVILALMGPVFATSIIVIDPPDPPEIEAERPTEADIALPPPVVEPFVPDVDLRLANIGSVRNCHADGGTVLEPIVRVPPEYPTSLRHPTKGYASVQFDVTSEGTVQNARIIESEPAGFFDRSALRAIAQWQYVPPVDNDGNSVTVCDQSMRFAFKSVDDELAE